MLRDLTGAVSAPLEFSPEQRARLGLGEGESVRVLCSSRRTLMLERTGVADAVALPFDRDLVLSADVRAFSLADLLNLVHASSKSGFLYFEHAETVRTVYLHDGEVVFATSNQRVDRLGECLVRSGAITRDQQRQADAGYRPPSPYGRYLVQLGFLSPRDLWDGVKHQVEENVRSLFSFGAGHVHFWEGEVRPDNVVRLALPTRRLVAEGLSQRDELLPFVAHLEDPMVRLVPEEGAAERLGGTERAILRALDEVDTFPTLCRRVGMDPLSGARTVQLLQGMNGLRIATLEEGSTAAAVELEVRQTEGESLRECVRAHVKLLAELAAPIVALDGAEPMRERLSQVATEASARYPELLGALEVGPGGVIDPERLVKRALCFPGEREREVRMALGELVSYLEFELLNHPGIDDAEMLLEALEPLRADL
jgi:hypothetical protein